MGAGCIGEASTLSTKPLKVLYKVSSDVHTIPVGYHEACVATVSSVGQRNLAWLVTPALGLFDTVLFFDSQLYPGLQPMSIGEGLLADFRNVYLVE
eukprot:3661624-Amphidinium_carterae.1